jgi:hypothetical protein
MEPILIHQMKFIHRYCQLSLVPSQVTPGTINSTARQVSRVTSSTLVRSSSRPLAWRNTHQRLGLAAADKLSPKGPEVMMFITLPFCVGLLDRLVHKVVKSLSPEVHKF